MATQPENGPDCRADPASDSIFILGCSEISFDGYGAIRLESVTPRAPQREAVSKISQRRKDHAGSDFPEEGFIVPEHHHPSEQICFILTGRLRFTLEGREVIRASNQLISIPSQVPHTVEAIEDTLAYDIFSPIREDWIKGEDAYLRR